MSATLDYPHLFDLFPQGIPTADTYNSPSTVYAWERKIWGGASDKYPSLQNHEVRRILDMYLPNLKHVVPYKPFLQEFAATKAYYNASQHCVAFKDGYAKLPIVLHELAHALTKDTALFDHGKIFMGQYLKLLDAHEVIPWSESYKSAEQHGLLVDFMIWEEV